MFIYIQQISITLQTPTQMHSNPRITTYVSTTKDQNNATKIIGQLRQMQNPSVHFILCKCLQCPILKDQPDFIQILFEHHTHVIVEMIQWMLLPKVVARRKKMKANLDFFPFKSKEFMKDNLAFYQHLYLAARSNRLPINIWFNFLRKQFYDKQTILTALGYFAEVMIPFAKYQFSSSSNLSLSMQLNPCNDATDILSIMKILPKQLIEQLVQYCHYEPIFQFLKTSILVSIEDAKDYDISRKAMLKIFQSSQIPDIFEKLSNCASVASLLATTSQGNQNNQQIQHHIDLLQNVSLCLKELITNLEPGNNMQLRIEAIIHILLESNMITYTIKEVIKSRLCNNSPSKQQVTNLSSSQQYITEKSANISSPLIQSALISSSGSAHSGRITTASPKSSINVLSDPEEQDLMQVLLKILNYCVEIYIKIPKVTPVIKKSAEDIAIMQTRDVNYKLLINSYRQKMQYLLHSLQTMTSIVYVEGESSSNVKSIPFSSGQKIKPITFMKFQYLKLLQNCLVMIQLKDTTCENADKGSEIKALRKQSSIYIIPFDVNFEKLHFIPIIQKYLSENRWNNVVHHVLEKICHLLIICSYEQFLKNIEKDKNKKLTQSFLAFLIENFTQRDYIFLNTFKFTTQGNLQSIYNISRDLAYTLNSTNQLVILLNDFQPWKKFLMNDLKLYEEKIYPKGTKPDVEYREDQASQCLQQVKVDEVESIKKLIQNISTTKKWPTKISKHKGNSKSGVFDFRKSDEHKQTPQKSSMSRSHGFHVQNNKQKRQLKKTLDDFAKKKVDESIEYDNQNQMNEMLISSKSTQQEYQMMMKSDVKTTEKQIYNVFKNYSSKVERKSSEGN